MEKETITVASGFLIAFGEASGETQEGQAIHLPVEVLIKREGC